MKSKIINLKKTKTLSSGTLIPNGIDVLEELIAEEGQYITQASDVDVLDRLILSKIMLGKNQSKDNWKDMSAEEASAIKNEQIRVIQEMEEKERIEHEKQTEELENNISND